MSLANRSSAPGRMMRCSSVERLRSATKRRLWWRVLGHGSGKRRKTRSRLAVGQGLEIRWPGIAVTDADVRDVLGFERMQAACATPLRNGSAPMKPTSGWARAWAARCSPPPKPISSQTSAQSPGMSEPGSKAAWPSRKVSTRRRGQHASATQLRLSCGRKASALCAARRAGSAAARTPAHFAERRFDRVDEVGLLPGEAAILLRRAAEMAVGGGARIDRLVEAQMRRGCRAASGS